MSLPVVSIIIPNFNNAAFLHECLNSCLQQGSYVKEIIVVDDHSTDNSISILEAYRSKYNCDLKIFKNPGKGACAARNFGYKKSTGEFIQFLDADDVISPNKLGKQVNELLRFGNYENKLIHCRWGRFYNDKIDEVSWWGPHELIKRDLKPADWLIANHMSMTGCWLTPRKLIEKGGLWDETLRRNQDGEFFSRLMTHADEVLYCDEAKVYYRSGNTGSVSNVKSRPAMESLLRSLQLIEEYMLQLEISPRVNLSIANRYQDFVYANFIANPDLAAIAESKTIELGGSELKLPGGAVLRYLATLFGWKNALRIKRIINRSS